MEKKIHPSFAQFPGLHTYKVTHTQILQGKFRSVAKSRKKIVSNFPEKKKKKSLLAKISESAIEYVSDLFPENEILNRKWELTHDLNSFPKFKSKHTLFDALYNLSLEEVLLNKNESGTFDTGANWPGVWTRDVSYAIILSLGMLDPETAKKSLMERVKNGMIIQDTGTGGSWPISTDRMLWVIAAWEIFNITGDKEWLEEVFLVAEKSAAADMVVAWNPMSNLFYGESSFLDWREQTYPKWMKSKDIFRSHALGTNIIMAEAYRIMGLMEEIIEGESTFDYFKVAKKVSESINQRLWNPEKGFYSQFLCTSYGQPSPRADYLGESLSVLFGVASTEKGGSIISKTPVLPFGTPCIFPQIPGQPPYHNQAIWPLVQAFWNWSSAKVQNLTAVTHGLNAMIRATALFLTNKENFNCEEGGPFGMEVNSDRQLWSVAGFVAMVYRVLLGMKFEQDGIHFNPCVPKSFSAGFTLSNFKFRDCILTISCKGMGTDIESFELDGKKMEHAVIPTNLTGEHEVLILMGTENEKISQITLSENKFSLPAPRLTLSGKKLKWNEVEGAVSYELFKNGHSILFVPAAEFKLSEGFTLEKTTRGSVYQITAIDKDGDSSFLSRPVADIFTFPPVLTYPSVSQDDLEGEHKGYKGVGYLRITPEKYTSVAFDLHISQTGIYRFDFRYANGNGPINTGDSCGVRSIFNGKEFIGPVVFPQLGEEKWSEWYYSNENRVHLTAGNHTFFLKYMKCNQNMNGSVNEAFIDHMRMIIMD